MTGHVVNDPLTPSTVIPSNDDKDNNGKSSISSELFKTPIMILTSRSLTGIRDLTLTLETLIRQTGIEPRNVVVFYDRDCCSVVKHLANLFGFMSSEYRMASPELTLTPQTIPRQVVFLDALQTIQLLFPEGNQILIIESHVILSPDLLPFFGQMIPVLSGDDELVGVTAWNENGFLNTSSDSSLLYRANEWSYPLRFAFMIKRIPWLTNFVIDNLEKFARKQEEVPREYSLSFDDHGYTDLLRNPNEVDETDNKQILVPDVSRVSLLVSPDEPGHELRMQESSSIEDKKSLFLKHFMSHPRLINLKDDVSMSNVSPNVSSQVSYNNMIKWMTTISRAFVNCNEAVDFIESMTQVEHKHVKESEFSLSDYDRQNKASK